MVNHEQPDLIALSTATAGVLDGVASILGSLAALFPRPLIVVGGQFWTAETGPTALELGADLVVARPARARRAAARADPAAEMTVPLIELLRCSPNFFPV